MKCITAALAASAMFAAGGALACDDLRAGDDSMASKAPEKPAVVAEKVEPAQPAKKVAVKPKPPVKSVAQAPARTAVN